MNSDAEIGKLHNDLEEEGDIQLENWAVVLVSDMSAGIYQYCHPEEHCLRNLHLKGVKVIEYNGDSVPALKGQRITLKRLTSHLVGFKDGAFITRSGSRYVLRGDPDATFASIFGKLAPKRRLEEVVSKMMRL